VGTLPSVVSAFDAVSTNEQRARAATLAHQPQALAVSVQYLAAGTGAAAAVPCASEAKPMANPPSQPMKLKDAYRDEWLFEFSQTGEDDSGVDYRVSIKREDYRMKGAPEAPRWFSTIWEVDIRAHRKVDEQDPDDVRVLLVKPALLEVVARLSSLIWTAAQRVRP
jgi:hypothetical protein